MIAPRTRAQAPTLGRVADFLKTHPTFVRARRRGGMTLLHHAAGQGRVGWAAALLAMGADVNAEDDGGWTPLFHAVANGQAQMVRFLRHHGAVV